MNTARISHYTIVVDLHDEEYLLVNGLYGYIDLLSKEKYLTLAEWIKNGVSLRSQKDEDFYYSLLNRKYIMSAEDENQQKAALIQKLCEKRQKLIEEPTSATFIPSYKCNFDCPYCYEKELNRSSPIMTQKQVDTIISTYGQGQLKYIGLYGGEPFLPEHKEIIEYIMSVVPGAEYSAITNGYYLEEFIPLLRKVKVRQIQVTFDGTKEVHNKTRRLYDGSGSYDRVLAGVRKCIQNRIPVKVRMNINHSNVEDCFRFKEWLTQDLNNSSLLSFDMQELFQYSGETQAVLTRRLLEESNVGKKNIILDSMPRLARFLYNGKPVSPIISNCVSSGANRFFDPYGNIYSCFLSVGHPERAVGSFEPVLSYKDNSILTRVASEITECYNCKYLFLCGGGCPNALFNASPSVMRPNCQNMQYTLQHAIPLIYKTVYKARRK